MGTSRQSEAAEDNWSIFAGCAGWRCSVCGCVPPYSERAVYLRTKMCQLCGSAHAELSPDGAVQSADRIG
jgi:hypothetical protein